VLTIAAGGGRPRIVTQGAVIGAYPSFSRDGQRIYFAGPNGEGQLRVWKIPPSGGSPIQVTEDVGALEIESYDGRDVYYLEAGERPSALWRIPTSGGERMKVLDGVVNASFDLTEHGIYFIDLASATQTEFLVDRPAGEACLRHFDFATRQITTVVRDLGRLALGLSASRDGRTVFFARVDSAADELLLVDHFR
jgi:hypothetical protein